MIRAAQNVPPGSYQNYIGGGAQKLTNILIKDLCVDGNRANITPFPNDTYCNGINLNFVSDTTVDSCFIKNVNAQGIIFFGGDATCKRNVVQNCEVTATGEVGIGLEAYQSSCRVVDNIVHDMTVSATFPGSCVGILIGAIGIAQDGHEANLFAHNILRNIPGTGIVIEDGTQQAIISDNIIDNAGSSAGYGIEVDYQSSGFYPQKYSICDNVLINLADKNARAIQVNGTTSSFGYFLIEGNRIDSCQGGGILVGGSTNSSIVGNHLNLIGLGAGAAIPDGIILGTGAVNTLVAENYVSNAVGVGIHVFSGATGTIIGLNALLTNTGGAITNSDASTIFSGSYDGTNTTINTPIKTAVTASRAVVTDASSILVASATTATEIGFVNGVTSSIQTQLNSKGSGTVTAVSVVSANGLAGTSSGGATPALTLSTTVTGILQGNGTTISAATLNGTGAVVLTTNPILVTPNLGTPSALVGTNITGTAAGLTAGSVTTNANLTGPITSVGNATSIASQTGTGTTFAMQAGPTFTGVVTHAAGNVSAPSINLSDAGTGFYRPALNVIGFTSNGAASGQITASANWQIGTASFLNFTAEKMSLANADSAGGSSAYATQATQISLTSTTAYTAASTTTLPSAWNRLQRTIATSTTDTASMGAAADVVRFNVSAAQTLTNTSTDGVYGLMIQAATNQGAGTLALTQYSGLRVQADSLATGGIKAGLSMGDVTGGTSNFAIKTGLGAVSFGDVLSTTGNTGAVRTVTTTATVAATDDTILASTAGGSYALTLPAASAGRQVIFIIKTTSDSNTLTITAAGADTITGQASVGIDRRYDTCQLWSDGVSAWEAVRAVRANIADAIVRRDSSGNINAVGGFFTSSSQSTSAATGGMTLAGGFGIGKNVFVGGALLLGGATSGTATIQTAAVTTSYTSTWPAAPRAPTPSSRPPRTKR